MLNKLALLNLQLLNSIVAQTSLSYLREWFIHSNAQDRYVIVSDDFQ